MRVAPLYTRLAAIQDEYLEQADAILGGLETPVERLAVIDEMRRQNGCLQAELMDRYHAIEREQYQETIRKEMERLATQEKPSCESTPRPETPDSPASTKPAASPKTTRASRRSGK